MSPPQIVEALGVVEHVGVGGIAGARSLTGRLSQA